MTTCTSVAIEDVKIGDFFKRKADAKKVYRRAAYCKFAKRYIGDDWDDISRNCEVKKGTMVFIGFDF